VLPVGNGMHDVEPVKCAEQVSVRQKAWSCGTLTLATEMVMGFVITFQMSKYIYHGLPVQVPASVAPPLHHPGVHTDTIQDKVQNLRQVDEEGWHSEQRLKINKDSSIIIDRTCFIYNILCYK